MLISQACNDLFLFGIHVSKVSDELRLFLLLIKLLLDEFFHALIMPALGQPCQIHFEGLGVLRGLF